MPKPSANGAGRERLVDDEHWHSPTHQRPIRHCWRPRDHHEPKYSVQEFDSCGGQHDHPKGLFYGGTSPSAARLTLTKILAEHLKHAQDISIIDFHTGLGPPGFGELMTTAPPCGVRAREWCGISVIPVGAAASASAAIGGDGSSYAPTLLPPARITAIAVEFGTLYVDDEVWHGMVLCQALAASRAALTGLRR